VQRFALALEARRRAQKRHLGHAHNIWQCENRAKQPLSCYIERFDRGGGIVVFTARLTTALFPFEMHSPGHPFFTKSNRWIVEAGHRARTTHTIVRRSGGTRRGHQAHSRAPGWDPRNVEVDRIDRLLRHSPRRRGNPLQGGQVSSRAAPSGCPASSPLRRPRRVPPMQSISCRTSTSHRQIRKTLNKDGVFAFQHDVLSTARTSMARGPLASLGWLRAVQVAAGARYRGQAPRTAPSRASSSRPKSTPTCAVQSGGRPPVP